MISSSENEPADIVQRLQVERPWLNIDEADNLVASWFRVAIHEHAKSGDAYAFVPFADAFSGLSFADGFERFMRREKHILETNTTSTISAADFEELLRVEMIRHLGASGGAFSVFRMADSTHISETAFQHFDVLMRLDPEAAMNFAADSVAYGHYFADRKTINGTPAPLRLLNHCSEIGVGSSPATQKFHRNLLDWCLINLGQEDALATAGQLLPVVFQDIKTTAETQQKAATLQADFLLSLLKPSGGYGTILAQIELQIDQEHEEGYGIALESLVDQLSNSVAYGTEREFSKKLGELGGNFIENSMQCSLTSQFVKLQQDKSERTLAKLKLTNGLFDRLRGNPHPGVPAHGF